MGECKLLWENDGTFVVCIKLLNNKMFSNYISICILNSTDLWHRCYLDLCDLRGLFIASKRTIDIKERAKEAGHSEMNLLEELCWQLHGRLFLTLLSLHADQPMQGGSLKAHGAWNWKQKIGREFQWKQKLVLRKYQLNQ